MRLSGQNRLHANTPPSLESMNAGGPTVMECFRLSASSSRRACWRKGCQYVQLLVEVLGPTAHARLL
jgi:hypothetical protein